LTVNADAFRVGPFIYNAKRPHGPHVLRPPLPSFPKKSYPPSPPLSMRVFPALRCVLISLYFWCPSTRSIVRPPAAPFWTPKKQLDTTFAPLEFLFTSRASRPPTMLPFTRRFPSLGLDFPPHLGPWFIRGDLPIPSPWTLLFLCFPSILFMLFFALDSSSPGLDLPAPPPHPRVFAYHVPLEPYFSLSSLRAL